MEDKLFLQNMNMAPIDSIVWAWAQTLSEEERLKAIKRFRDFWTKGIIFSMTPCGDRISIEEITKRRYFEDIALICQTHQEYQDSEINERVKMYVDFRAWLAKILKLEVADSLAEIIKMEMEYDKNKDKPE